jgi:hypothetical protein
MHDESTDENLDVLWGAEAIARVINRTRRQTHHLLNRGAIDAAKKIGGRWCAERNELRRQFRARQPEQEKQSNA